MTTRRLRALLRLHRYRRALAARQDADLIAWAAALNPRPTY